APRPKLFFQGGTCLPLIGRTEGEPKLLKIPHNFFSGPRIVEMNTRKRVYGTVCALTVLFGPALTARLAASSRSGRLNFFAFLPGRGRAGGAPPLSLDAKGGGRPPRRAVTPTLGRQRLLVGPLGQGPPQRPLPRRRHAVTARDHA